MTEHVGPGFWQRHVAEFHEDFCDGNRDHWVSCSRPYPIESPHKRVACPPDCTAKRRTPFESTRGEGGSSKRTAPADEDLRILIPPELILERTYAFTKSRTKLLTLGMMVREHTDSSGVVLFLTDMRREQRCQKLYLTEDDWEGFIANWDTFAEWFGRNEEQLEMCLDEFVQLDRRTDLRASCVKFLGKPALRLSSRELPAGIVMMAPTCRRMLEVYPCVRAGWQELTALTTELKRRLRLYRGLLYAAREEGFLDSVGKKKLLMNSDGYNDKSRLDAELVALCLDLDSDEVSDL